MKKPLLDVIFASEKRKNVLLLLQDGSKKMQFILKALNTTRQALLPQIRILEEHYLVTQLDDSYELTTIGKLMADEMKPLLDTVKIFNMDIDYWGTRDLSFIPPYLFKRIGELKQCKSIDVPPHEIFSENKQFTKKAKKSKSVFVISSYAFPNFEKTLHELIANNVSISIIISKDLCEKLLREHLVIIKKMIRNQNIKLYMYADNFDFLQVSINDYNILLELLREDGNYDSKKVTCSGENAPQWGKELFEHYLKNSTPITEL
ncbi:helix-turn-helix transcriptional regulator [Methanolobus halotolerans]|uniref:Transcriptional regulator n=1 Tax=Methanolobus halotolerans TaxID=2052935 RepID=A0A4E0PUJ0_9EURY|nr:winged helix-turn-helix domain-containing protein [Methanolobus halotolerans]TGC06985.1 transcriptional regulator [Methanolobus halotolerans]